MNLQALLSNYYTLSLLLVIEFHDHNDNLIYKVHTVTVKFDILRGAWCLLDQNLESILTLDTQANRLELLHSAYAVTVFQWDQVHASTDPDRIYKQANISYNKLR